jgi:hypothetical protein
VLLRIIPLNRCRNAPCHTESKSALPLKPLQNYFVPRSEEHFSKSGLKLRVVVTFIRVQELRAALHA